jgi:cytochrome c oxidase subunit 2/cytochrome aa3-600 menaquinol oxidase subunit 2
MTTLLALNGCEGRTSTLQTAGPAARVIADLWWVMLIGSVLIFGMVMVLLVLAFVRRRPAAEADEAGQVRVWIIALGLGFPMVVLAVLLGFGLVIGERLLPRSGGDTVQVGAQGQRWVWTFTYDDAPGRVTEDVLHIPAGRPVDVAVTTVDVIHSFWVPRLAGKLDAIPGRTNVLRIEADTPGDFQGLSAEFSGEGYTWFGFIVRAHDPTDWTAFINGETEEMTE